MQTKLELRRNVALSETVLLLQTCTKHKIPALINVTSLVSSTLKPSATWTENCF